MKLTSLRPILWTQHMEETIAFYTELLNFTLAEKNDDWGWASLYQGEVGLMLAIPNAHTVFEKPAFTGSFYFEIEEVDALWEQLKNKVRVVYEPETFEWEMREFGIYDNNGYLLQFGQRVFQ